MLSGSVPGAESRRDSSEASLLACSRPFAHITPETSCPRQPAQGDSRWHSEGRRRSAPDGWFLALSRGEIPAKHLCRVFQTLRWRHTETSCPRQAAQGDIPYALAFSAHASARCLAGLPHHRAGRAWHDARAADQRLGHGRGDSSFQLPATAFQTMVAADGSAGHRRGGRTCGPGGGKPSFQRRASSFPCTSRRRRAGRRTAVARGSRRRQRRHGAACSPAAAGVMASSCTITVTTFSVAPDSNLSTCTLVEAINAANTNTNSGGCQRRVSGGADTICLPAGTYRINNADNGCTGGTAGLPCITSDITIVGDNGRATIERNNSGTTPTFRLFKVESGTLTVENLVIQNGYPGDSATNPWHGGGAIEVVGGTLTIRTVR